MHSAIEESNLRACLRARLVGIGVDQDDPRATQVFDVLTGSSSSALSLAQMMAMPSDLAAVLFDICFLAVSAPVTQETIEHATESAKSDLVSRFIEHMVNTDEDINRDSVVTFIVSYCVEDDLIEFFGEDDDPYFWLEDEARKVWEEVNRV